MVQISNQTNCEIVETTAAKKLHPEDINVGDDVAVSDVIYQYPTFLWFCHDAVMSSREQPVRITFESPLQFDAHRVESICLPFVLVSSYKQKAVVFDLRRTQLFKLSPEFARLFRDKKKKRNKRKTKKRKRA